MEKNQVQLLLVNELLECLIMEIMKLKEKKTLKNHISNMENSQI